jgi:hypothetical protein
MGGRHYNCTLGEVFLTSRPNTVSNGVDLKENSLVNLSLVICDSSFAIVKSTINQPFHRIRLSGVRHHFLQ